ncbi:MAG: nitroreductase family protein [Clostridia bacterium]|nr:nitroreductase family protein [Clostridia bacterium]
MNFHELATTRYSVRSFKKEMIDQRKLNAILEAGRVAPTAKNNQPQKIYVVKNAEKLGKLAEVCRYTFDAPVILVIGYDKEREWQNPLMPGYTSGETDAAIVCTHMMLAAWEEGIGSCWVGYFNEADIRAALDLPDTVRVTAMLPIGYPADDATPSARHSVYRELEDTVTTI